MTEKSTRTGPAIPGRQAGAPRLLEWTGERCVPWAPDVQVVYEHLHRYLWAAGLVAGRRVLDLASGEGFGAAILAEVALSVDAIEIDARSVDHSRLNYVAPNLRFSRGDARDLSRFDARSFGAVVAFEMIEHITAQDQVLAEIARVLSDDGLLILSTPDRSAYSDATGQRNPFHERELTRVELEDLLHQRFEHVSVWGQRTVTGSAISAIDAIRDAPTGASPPVFVERAGEEWRRAEGMSPLYLVVLASQNPLPTPPPDAALLDAGLALLRQVERDAERAAAGRLAEVEARAVTRAHDQERLRRLLADREREIESVRAERDELRARLSAAEARATQLGSELTAARAAIWRIGRVMSSNTIENVRGRIYYGLGGPGSPGVRAVQAVLRLVARLRGRDTDQAHRGAVASARTPLPEGPIELPRCDQPEVSIVIPLYARADLTRRCLASIVAHTGGVAYEVILVDDTADAATKRLLAEVRGGEVVANPENIGYLRSVNEGAARARGEWLILANNDIEVTEGWLGSMRDCAAGDPQIGIVTPRYVYPDGRLCEAGAIIWRDGTGWNYGRNDDPADPRYGFRREVDYGSAAALLVRRDVWLAAGGFDERFVPMYFEDVDLCFAAREQGFKVVYDPGATVIHHEGASAGTDVSAGHKRHQAVNRPRFVEKWGARLEREHRPPDPGHLRDAADRRRGPHVFIVDHRVPMWDRDAGALRMLGMLQTFLDLGCRVTFLPDNLHPSAPYTAHLQRLGVEMLYGPLDVESALREMADSVRLAILCRPEPASRWIDAVRRCLPQATIAYDTVDLHWLRETRRAEAESNGVNAAPSVTAVALREMETALFRAADATIVVTDDEGRLVAADAPGKPVFVVPTVHLLRVPVPAVERREGVLFIGGFEHPPNVVAALRLVERLMPIVWEQLGDVPVRIVGGSAPPELRRLASGRVEVTGWVPDVGPLLDSARVLVAPMTYGAGLKGKVTQSLAAGLPVVTTTIGAEGLGAVDGRELLIADDDAGLAERAVRVLADAALWGRLSAAGQELVDRVCSPAVMERRLIELLESFGCEPAGHLAATRASHGDWSPSP